MLQLLAKNTCLFALTALVGGAALAQSPLPPGTAPFSGEITVRYTPTFESHCTVKKHEKKPGEFFGSLETTSVTGGVFEDSQGVLKLSSVADTGALYMRLLITLKEDGSGFASNELELQVGRPGLTAEDKKSLPIITDPRIKELMFNTIKIGLGRTVEFPLRLGSDMSMTDVCKIFPQGRTTTKAGRYEVIGTAAIRGRESIIYDGEETFTCTLADKQFTMQMKGWEAIDRQSGLLAGLSQAVVMTEQGGNVTTSTEDRECVISGSLTRTPKAISPGSSGVKSIEQRLIELKTLMDKGLISQEQYEQKRVEILKAL